MIKKPVHLSDWIQYLIAQKNHAYSILTGFIALDLGVITLMCWYITRTDFVGSLLSFIISIVIAGIMFYIKKDSKSILNRPKFLLEKIMQNPGKIDVDEIRKEWYMKDENMVSNSVIKKKIKLFEVFDYSEKQHFVEILLIISGIMAGFNPSAIKTSIFVTFASSAIAYIIWLSIVKKIVAKRKFSGLTSFSNIILSAFVSSSFSGLTFIVGIQANLEGIKTLGDLYGILGMWLIFYFMLGVLLIYVLCALDPDRKFSNIHNEKT
jgi:hypothetical protein